MMARPHVPEVIDMMQELHGLDRKQARDCYANTIKPSHSNVLTNIVKAQATTTARSAITVSQQWRWHCLVESTWNELVALNRDENGVGSEEYPS